MSFFIKPRNFDTVYIIFFYRTWSSPITASDFILQIRLLCPRDESQGALRFAPVYLSVRSSHLKVQNLCNQLFLQFSMDLFQTLLACCGHNEAVHVGF